jgi:hypothetical protein
MEPFLATNDKIMFYKYLDKANVYFEYGSGGSTYQANIRNNIRKIYSVESDINWINTIKNNIQSNKINFFFNEMNTQPNSGGNPGPNSTHTQWINYSNHMRNLSKDEQKSIDFVLIDGRFRVASCLKWFDIIGSDCLIAFDDFLNRMQYYVVLDYYNIIEKTEDNRMVILQKKENIISIPNEIIEKYELIRD